jgi:hypothetical protein
LTFIRRENFSPFRLAPILLFILLVFFISSKIFFKGGDIMKKILIQLFIIAVTVMTYVLPVLADGGGE